MEFSFLNPVFSALLSAFIGAIIPVILTPCFKDFYSRRKEVTHIKNSLKRYVSYMDESLPNPFMYGSSSTREGQRFYHLSVMTSNLEQTLSGRRFDKDIMLSERDYREILDYCYKQGISHFDLDEHEKVYMDLFKKKKYDFV